MRGIKKVTGFVAMIKLINLREVLVAKKLVVAAFAATFTSGYTRVKQHKTTTHITRILWFDHTVCVAHQKGLQESVL